MHTKKDSWLATSDYSENGKQVPYNSVFPSLANYAEKQEVWKGIRPYKNMVTAEFQRQQDFEKGRYGFRPSYMSHDTFSVFGAKAGSGMFLDKDKKWDRSINHRTIFQKEEKLKNESRNSWLKDVYNKNSTWLEKRKEHDQVLDDRQCKGTGIRNIPDIVGL